MNKLTRPLRQSNPVHFIAGGRRITTSPQPANAPKQAAMRGMLFTQATGLEALP